MEIALLTALTFRNGVFAVPGHALVMATPLATPPSDAVVA